jgi:hypothetical protein
MMDVEDSWKGRIWLLYYIWPFVFAMLLPEIAGEYGIWCIVLLTAGTATWIYGTYILIKRLREVFRKKE